MHGYSSDLHWVIPQCTYLFFPLFVPYIIMESHNWVNAKRVTGCMLPNDYSLEPRVRNLVENLSENHVVLMHG